MGTLWQFTHPKSLERTLGVVNKKMGPLKKLKLRMLEVILSLFLKFLFILFLIWKYPLKYFVQCFTDLVALD